MSLYICHVNNDSFHSMKNITRISVFLIAISIVAACNKLISFEVGYDDTFTVPANGLAGSTIEISTTPSSTDTQEESGQNGSAISISEVKLSSLSLTIVSPDSANFNFVKDVEIFILGPNLPETRIAYHYDVPANNLTEIPFTCETTNLVDYFQKATYYFKVRATTDEELPQDIQVRVDSKMKIGAGLK